MSILYLCTIRNDLSIRYNNKKSETKNPRKRKASSISTKEKRMHHDQDTSKVMAEIVSNTNLQDSDNGGWKFIYKSN